MLFRSVDDVDYVTVRWIALGMIGILVYGVTEPMVAVPVGWFVLVTIAADAQRLARSRELVV